MEVIIGEGERHIQINDFHAEDEAGYRDYWKHLLDKYEGYEVDFCYHNSDAPNAFMQEIGAALLEKCIETRLVQKDFVSVNWSSTTPVTEGNFAAFAKIHNKTNPNMYWTSERIRKDLSRWSIYTNGNNYVLMSLWGSVAEIYALEAGTASECAELLSAAAGFAFKAGKTGVLIMIDDSDMLSAEAARAIGFKECGRYIAYRGIVK